MRASDAVKLRKLRDPGCRNCGLAGEAKTVCVFGPAGKLPVFVVGEAPGKEEDISGNPFVGRSGKLLRYELAKANLPPSSLYFTNIAKCFPSESKTPTEEQSRICADTYLHRELELLKPRYILACGKIASEFTTIGGYQYRDIRGRANRGIGGTIVFSIFHPSYILRNRRASVLKAWQNDLEDFAFMVQVDLGLHATDPEGVPAEAEPR